MLVVGLTGGIGSGKSTVASMMQARGAIVIDVDQLGRDVIAPGGRAEAGVLAEFGPEVTGEDGAIHRPSLARVVFGSPDALARLEAISHPAINAELVERLAALPHDATVVLDMAILVESNLGRSHPTYRYSHVVLVDAPLELRVARAVARGMREADVRARAAAQATDEERHAAADLVLSNDADLATLQDRVAAAWPIIAGWAAGAPSDAQKT